MPSSSPTAKLDGPANIMLPPLTPRAPALNPMETIWRFMRDNWLSNRIFKSYEDIVAALFQVKIGRIDSLRRDTRDALASRARLQETKLQNPLLRPCSAFRRAA